MQRLLGAVIFTVGAKPQEIGHQTLSLGAAEEANQTAAEMVG